VGNNFFIVTATVVLLPLVPAYILFKFLPSEAGADGPYSGLTLKLKGAFAGYFIVLLAVMSFFHTLPSNEDEIWTIKGRVAAPGIENVEDLRVSFVPDQSQHKTPDLAFKMRVMVPRNAQGKLDFPDIVIEHPLYSTQTIHLDQDQPDCKLAMTKDEVDITGNCLKLTKRDEKRAAFETSVVSLPEH
jgi:hypothetical protein